MNKVQLNVWKKKKKNYLKLKNLNVGNCITVTRKEYQSHVRISIYTKNTLNF